MTNKNSPSNFGAVVSVRGSVVDIRFEAHLPSIYSLLHAQEGKIAIEVLAQLDAHRVRGIALTAITVILMVELQKEEKTAVFRMSASPLNILNNLGQNSRKTVKPGNTALHTRRRSRWTNKSK